MHVPEEYGGLAKSCGSSCRRAGTSPRWSTPGNPKASYRVGTTDERDPDQWASAAEVHRDSWWPDCSAWLAARGGEQKAAPKKLGTRGLSPLTPAPGTYVHER